MSKTQPARGMRDFLPADVRRREYVMHVIREVYERYGFEPLETPAVENIETLLGKYGEEGNQLIFKILKRGEHEKTGTADLALRYDLTVPLARVVAEYGSKLPKFFKRYQMQPVWRADRPARGRFREFYQCDVDAIGSRSMIVEAELCAAASDALTTLGFNDFTIRLNHRRVLEGLLDQVAIPREKHADTLTAIDKLDKIGTDGVLKELIVRGISQKSGESLIEFLQGLETIFIKRADLEEWNKDALKSIGKWMDGHDAGELGVDELQAILSYANANGVGHRIKIDPSLARGLSYYTGAIMEINVPDLAGSLGGGGRYDNLVGMFSGRDIPACGFSLGLERIIVVMTEREMFPAELVNAPADVLVTIWDEDATSDALALAQELRAAGVRASLYPEAGDKVGKQFKYAAAIGVPFVTIAGPNERERGEVALKDMRSGEQGTIKREFVSTEIRKALGEDNSLSPIAKLSEINKLAFKKREQGDLLEARRLLTQSLEIYKNLGDRYNLAVNLYSLGDIAQRQGELIEARRLYVESLKIARELGIKTESMNNLLELGSIAEEQGDSTEATQLLEEAFKISDELTHYAELQLQSLTR